MQAVRSTFCDTLTGPSIISQLFFQVHGVKIHALFLIVNLLPMPRINKCRGLSIEADHSPPPQCTMQGSVPIGIVAKHVIVFPIKTDDLWAQDLKGALHFGLVG